MFREEAIFRELSPRSSIVAIHPSIHAGAVRLLREEEKKKKLEVTLIVGAEPRGGVESVLAAARRPDTPGVKVRRRRDDDASASSTCPPLCADRCCSSTKAGSQNVEAPQTASSADWPGSFATPLAFRASLGSRTWYEMMQWATRRELSACRCGV